MTITINPSETLRQTNPATRMRHGAIRHPDGYLPNHDGCRWCGAPYFGHRRLLWAASRGMHPWEQPTEAQVAARRAARARVEAEADARGPVRCEAMNHDSTGAETFCVNEDPDHREPHDDDNGVTWPVEDWDREAAG
ncbi:hypothetical protein [Streptomyces salinarius]|uniref:hypothetical protein n=1 Tax=Streptomyces salinarius TaxID=2762598 RepID=UPI0028525CAF|nr:hypothetical protein [Streptomyces salinarius]